MINGGEDRFDKFLQYFMMSGSVSACQMYYGMFLLMVEGMYHILDDGKNNSGNTEPNVNYQYKQDIDGLNKVRQHLTLDVDGMDFEPNNKMLQIIEIKLNNGEILTGAYKDFYEHELTEMSLMEQGYDYNTAHEMALEIHNVCPQQLYAPEVVSEFSKWFNKLDFEYWGIEP